MNNEAMIKSQSLVDALYEKTSAKSLVWEKTSANGTFQVAVGGRPIQLYKIKRGSAVDIYVDVYNSDGDKVDSFSDPDLSGTPKDPRYSSYFELMSSLFDLVSRQASGADKVLDDILKDLGSI
jgi:hypothetical protein